MNKKFAKYIAWAIIATMVITTVILGSQLF